MMDFSDDATVNNNPELIFQRFLMIYVIPGSEKVIDDNKVHLEAIRRINKIFFLVNTYLLVKVGPWIGSPTKKDKLIIEFLEDEDNVKQYDFDFN